MATRRERIVRLLAHTEGLTDREITDQLEGHSALQQPINRLCHRMEDQKILIRKRRADGLIGNYLIRKGQSTTNIASVKDPPKPKGSHPLPNEVQPQNSSESLKKILSLGFENVGRWFWDRDDLNFELTQHARERDILYAFVVDGEVKYLGKSVQTLYRRIYFYKNCGPSQRTNIRVREKIRTCLKNGSRVLIYAFFQKIPLMYQDIPINIATGLEDNLIAAIRPEWNMR